MTNEVKYYTIHLNHKQNQRNTFLIRFHFIIKLKMSYCEVEKVPDVVKQRPGVLGFCSCLFWFIEV